MLPHTASDLLLSPTSARYVDRLLRIIATQLNIRATLLTAVLDSLTAILTDCESLLFKKITYGLSNVVPLLQYIQVDVATHMPCFRSIQLTYTRTCIAPGAQVRAAGGALWRGGRRGRGAAADAAQ